MTQPEMFCKHYLHEFKEYVIFRLGMNRAAGAPPRSNSREISTRHSKILGAPHSGSIAHSRSVWCGTRPSSSKCWTHTEI